MKIKQNLALLALAAFLGACQPQADKSKVTEAESFQKGTFGYDLDFLNKKDSVLVLKSANGNAQIIVSAKYQGKVFTSTAGGPEGKSFGWVNYKAFEGEKDAHMNAYGGEDRLWLGPEGGKYSLFFKQGTKMEFDNWHTPPAVDSESWNITSANDKKVSLVKDMSLENYAGTKLMIKVERDINILENKEIENALGITLNDKIKAVGFKTDNSITNAGNVAWTTKTGAPCMWNLDMFTPSNSTVIVIPYYDKVPGKVATTNYFGEIPSDRIAYKNGILYLKADGKSRGKLGVSPKHAKPVAGSYDPSEGVLTITKFDVSNDGTYLNQEWTADKDPLIGDAVNAYNDGPLKDGTQMGPFYEVESVSPAAFLKPAAKLTHQHCVFHFTGDQKVLNDLSVKVLGVSLEEIQKAFK